MLFVGRRVFRTHLTRRQTQSRDGHQQESSAAAKSARELSAQAFNKSFVVERLHKSPRRPKRARDGDHSPKARADLLQAAADCPKARSARIHDRCKAVYEGLAAG
jgi:hypothetical protein